MMANILLVILILSGVIILFSWGFARLWCRPFRKKSTATPSDFGLHFEPVSFASCGCSVRGWFIPISGNEAEGPAVVLVHGWSKNAAKLLALASHYHASGLHVLLFDMRGHGASEGDGPVTIKKFMEDISAGIDYLETREDVNAEKIGVLGHSLGGSAAINTASQDSRIRALVSVSAFADPLELTRRTMKGLRIPRGPFLVLVSFFIGRFLGNPMASYAPLRMIGRVSVPMLLVHGEKDRFVPVEDLYTLHENANPALAKIHAIRGKGHHSVIAAINREHPVIQFMTNMIGGAREE